MVFATNAIAYVSQHSSSNCQSKTFRMQNVVLKRLVARHHLWTGFRTSIYTLFFPHTMRRKMLLMLAPPVDQSRSVVQTFIKDLHHRKQGEKKENVLSRYKPLGALSFFFSHSLSLSLTHTRSICYHNLVDIKNGRVMVHSISTRGENDFLLLGFQNANIMFPRLQDI